MSKLVRARVKPFELQPEWACGCEGWLEVDAEFGDAVVDVESVRMDPPGPCNHCNHELPESPVVRVIEGRYKGCVYYLELLDLDEGPLEETA